MFEEKVNSLLLRVARYVNETQPAYYATRLFTIIRMREVRRILFYGLGFKPDSPYIIESPPIKVAEELIKLDPTLEIRKYDPQMPMESEFTSEEEAIEWAELIVRWGYKGRKLSKATIELEEL